MVQRYNASYNDYYEADQGEFVTYEDYERLNQDFQDYITATDMELQELRAKLGLTS